MQCVSKHLDQFPRQIQAELAKKTSKTAAVWPEEIRKCSPVREGLSSRLHGSKTGVYHTRDVKKWGTKMTFFGGDLCRLQYICSPWGILSRCVVHIKFSQWVMLSQTGRLMLPELSGRMYVSRQAELFPAGFAWLSSRFSVGTVLKWMELRAQRWYSHHLWSENSLFQHYSSIWSVKSAFLKNNICFAFIL